MKIQLFLITLLISISVSSCVQDEKSCVITGKIINRPQSNQLRLTKEFIDYRSQSTVLIPIIDSTFTYELKYKDIEAYNLVFEDEYEQGGIRPIVFFPTNGTIDMELYPMDDFRKNIVSGGKENKEYFGYQNVKNNVIQPIQESAQTLMGNGGYYSQEMNELNEQLQKTEKQEDKSKIYAQIDELYQSGEEMSPAAKKLKTQYDSLMKIIQLNEIENIRENITIPNYYTLILTIQNSKDSPGKYDFDELCALQKIYSSRFKDHLYNNYSEEVIWQFTNLKAGGDFFDFTLPDLTGKEYTLSEEIKGKYALIDIWAPWCGPCITKSRQMIPVYEAYKNKDFTVIGISTKYEELSNVGELVEKDKYPWITLIDKPELDSRLNEHYGLEMAGGGCFLVDNLGKIVLVNPTVEEVKKVLEADL